MVPSFAGFIVCVSLLGVGWLLGYPLIIGLFASIPFGSTSIAELTALNGATPQIYTMFAVGLLISLPFRRRYLNNLGFFLAQQPSAWIVAALMLYAIGSSILFPRLFNAQTTALVLNFGAIVEQPLQPTSGNITQTLYFTLHALTFLALAPLFLELRFRSAARTGMVTMIVAHVALGFLDLGGKLLGFGDLLQPIRTAGYALLIDVQEAGFWRIAGGYSEASAFGTMSLACFAYSLCSWRITRSRTDFVLTILLLSLIMLSTSSTAYAGFVVLCAIFLGARLVDVFAGRLRQEDLILFGAGWLLAAITLVIFIYNDRLLDPFVDLLNSTFFDKASSSSARERAYWNEKGIEAFFDTFGVGIGFGSSRTSSWLVSLASQLGAAGLILFAALLFEFLRSEPSTPGVGTPEFEGLVSGARAAGLAVLTANSISGSSADPGVVFFIALAIVLGTRAARVLSVQPVPPSSFASAAGVS